jgi:hypothetical protein
VICPSGRFVEPIEKIDFYAHGLSTKISVTEADRCADSTRRANHQYLHIVIVCDKREAFAQGRALATKQSFSMRKERMDCFAEPSSGGAEPVIGRAFARPVGADPLARNDGAGGLTSTANAARAA